MKLTIFRASDAFLYLPTYIAEQLGIFETVLGSDVTAVEFRDSQGDTKAIMDMLDENNKTGENIAIAIADPTVFLGPRFKHKDKDNIRVVGAIINRLPFWAVDHIADTELDSIKDFGDKFSSIVHCKPKYATGHYLGTKIKNETGIDEGSEDAEFGQEISELINKNYERGVAITADIISVVQAEQQGLHINYKFSQKEGEHITTGILTAHKCCENGNRLLLDRIIESVQKSISILYCSHKTAENICKQLKETASRKIDAYQIKRVIQLIIEERFYPADLNISKECWNNGIKAISAVQQWNEHIQEDALNNSFEKYVNNEFVLHSERSIAKQFGIDVETFNNEITELKTNNTSLEKQVSILSLKNNQLETKQKFLNWIYILTIVVCWPFRWLFDKKYPKRRRAAIIIFVCAIIILIARLGAWIKLYKWESVKNWAEGISTLSAIVGLIVNLVIKRDPSDE